MSEKPVRGKAVPGAAPEEGKAEEEDSQILESLKALLQEEDLDPQDQALVEEEAEVPAPPTEQEKPKHAGLASRRKEASPGASGRKARDRQAFKDLGAQMAPEALGLEISADRLTARLRKIGPEDTYERIIDLLQSHKIGARVEHESIRAALAKARSGAHQYGVLVAQGLPPTVRRPARVEYFLPAALIPHQEETGLSSTPFDTLKAFLTAPSPGRPETWTGPVKLVHKGEVVAEVRPAEIEVGEDVFGEQMVPDQPELPALKAGENTALAADGKQCLAQVYGYAGLLEGVPTVLLPVWVSADLMEARFVYLPPAGPSPPPTSEEVEEVLKAKWIAHGVPPQRVARLCRQLAKGKTGAFAVTLAQGEPAQPGKNAQVKYSFELDRLPLWNQMQKVRTCKSRSALEAVLGEICQPDSGPLLKAVKPGEVLAEKVPPTQGIVGKDIQGEEVVAEEGKDVELKVGENVSRSPDGRCCTADIYGYVCRHANQLSVISPLWMSADRRVLYFFNLPGMSAAELPTLEEMQVLLSHMGKSIHGFNPERWVEIVGGLHPDIAAERLILVSEGTPVQAGRDAELHWAVDVQEKPGTIQEDGSIDFRDRHLVTVVDEGDLICRLIPSQAGVPGKDVLGADIAPAPVVEIEVVPGPKVRMEMKDTEGAFYAAAEGGVTTIAETKKDRDRVRKIVKVDLYALFTIDGDVDYNTGNINFNGDVYIKGSVRSHFSVKATGSINVGELIEGGARLTAGRNILVQAGVVGRDTHLVAGGSVMAKFVQEAAIKAGGDVKVGTYFLEATVRAGGSVVALGKGEGQGRAVVGGLVWGAQGVEARSLGSPANPNLRVVAGLDPDKVSHAEKLRAQLRASEERQKKVLLSTFGLRNLDLNLVKQKLRLCADPQEKKKLLLGVKAISDLTEQRQRLQKELEETVESQRQLARQGMVVVANELFTGVEIRIGEHTLKVQEDKQRVCVRLVEEEGKTAIQLLPL